MADVRTIVLVHGAWHGAWCWDRVLPLLAGAGADVRAVDLPGHGADPGPLEDLPGDTARVISVLDELDGPVLLVGHSYGGAVVTGAGTHPSVEHLVFIAAFALDAHESCVAAAADEAASIVHPERSLGDEMSVEDGIVVLSDAGVELLYNDCDAATVAWARANVDPHPLIALQQQPVDVAWRTTPSTYAICAIDQGVAPDLQRILARRCSESVTWETGHSPFASRPDLVAELLLAKATRADRP